ncbi:hypothetical protein LX97_03472 [Nonlabens dokdonensis]|uniref:Uncharacterized protein n=2 Tax=Nonlabens dokdonensis TaxID=328515 RepID=L7WDD5_NONDD|nr:hypothetical protein [Nonlabens dokdonensis]AGC77946.1 hypothetical protein DDD_2819 [Nonlabens dokdonensis DSW-6]PZX36238.1 hypothetical protein LX97_03472 [Nonlabens dokdonensis]
MENFKLHLINLSFSDLANKEADIEKSIFEYLRMLLYKQLKANNFDLRNGRIWIENKPIKVFINLANDSRKLLVEFICESSKEEAAKTIEINEFGGIRYIHFNYPISCDFASSIAETFGRNLSSIYRVLEKSYILNCIDSQGLMSKKIYALLDLNLEGLNIDANRCYFNVSEWNSQSKYFIYHINHSRLNKMITYYKKNQPKSKSPYFMVNTLLTARVPDIATEKALKNNNIANIPFSDFNYKDDNEHFDFWLAEKILFEDEDLVLNIITSHKNQYLEIIYPNSFREAFDSLPKDFYDSIINQFEYNFKDFKDYHKIINQKRLTESVFYKELKDFVVQVTANIGSQMLKP